MPAVPLVVMLLSFGATEVETKFCEPEVAEKRIGAATYNFGKLRRARDHHRLYATTTNEEERLAYLDFCKDSLENGALRDFIYLNKKMNKHKQNFDVLSWSNHFKVS